jgi:BMFP domain-containing protein YqiC
VKEWASKAEESTRDIDKKIKDAIGGAFDRLNIPSKDDFEKMEKKLQNISSRLRKLEGNGSGEE